MTERDDTPDRSEERASEWRRITGLVFAIGALFLFAHGLSWLLGLLR